MASNHASHTNPTLPPPLPTTGWKFIRFSPDGQLFIPIGAPCNACRLDGSPPNNGTVGGQFIFTAENSVNTSSVYAPYQ